MAAYIKLATSSNFRANRAARFLRLLRETLEAGREVNDVMVPTVADPVYTPVEGAAGYGVPAGDGQAFYNLITGAYARLNHGDVTAAINRIGE